MTLVDTSTWIDHFRHRNPALGTALTEGQVGLHPFVIGRPYRIRRLRRALQHILGHRDGVWLTRPRDICAHIEGLPKGVVPSSDES